MASTDGSGARPYEVGVYYFPNYHVDPRNEAAHGAGWTEWELVKLARPRFPGHRQPRVPLWGYEDEADPRVMARKIDAAADHGVDYWIFDWYWYDDGPYLSRCLEDGYMGAANNERVKFCCMWANHDWLNIHPARYQDPRPVQFPGVVTRRTFETIVEHVVSRYFTHPSHFCVDGRPYFSVYELEKLVASFGDVGRTREALDHFRAATRCAGFPDLHLNAVVWGQPVLPGEATPADPKALLADLGFDSFTTYVWIHHVAMPGFPRQTTVWSGMAIWSTGGKPRAGYLCRTTRTYRWAGTPRRARCSLRGSRTWATRSHRASQATPRSASPRLSGSQSSGWTRAQRVRAS